MRRKWIALCVACLILCGVLFTSCNQKKDEPPVITINGTVPSQGVFGRKVTLPAAGATDDNDGDISSKVKLDVYWYEGDQRDEALYRETANRENTFTPTRYANWKIEYYVTDTSGNETRLVYDFTGMADTQAPEIVITEAGFDVQVGVAGTNMGGYVLPVVKGTDQPGDYDITSSIYVAVYDNNANDALAVQYAYTPGAIQYLIAGDYTVKMTLKDGSGNEAEDVEFPLVITNDDSGKNLLSSSAIALGHDVSFNEFGELEVGKTSYGSSDDNCAAAAYKYSKLSDEYLAVSVNIDAPPSGGAELFYTISYINSKHKADYQPDGTEGQWPPSFILRIEQTRLALHINADHQFSGTTTSSSNIRDGKDHLLIFKFDKVAAEGSTPATMRMRIWLDQLPTDSGASPVLNGTVISGAANGSGVLAAATFQEIWDNPAGWLTFGSYSNDKNDAGVWGDDVMRVKGMAVYPDGETSFTTDITAPVLTLANSPALQDIYMREDSIAFPSATAVDGKDGDVSTAIEAYVLNDAGVRTGLAAYTFNNPAAGKYTLVYEVKDAAGNIQYYKHSFIISSDITPPEIALSSQGALTATTGTAFNLPTATASDDTDGDITSKIKLKVDGPDYIENHFLSGAKTTLTLYAAGSYSLVYSVADNSGNETTKTVSLTVSGVASGNIISKFSGYNSGSQSIAIASGSSTGYTDQKIYNEKVAMVMNVSNNNGLLFFSTRGNYTNSDWPNTMVLRFNYTAIDISSQGHDGYIFGRFENPFQYTGYRDKNILVEYQTKNVVYEGKDYVWFRLWIGGNELTPIIRNKGILYTDLYGTDAEAGASGICLAVTDFSNKSTQYAGPMYMVANSSAGNTFAASIKEIRIDGTACTTEYENITESGLSLPAISSTGATSLLGGGSLTANAADTNYLAVTTGQALNQAASSETAKVLESVTLSLNLGATQNSSTSWIMLLGSSAASGVSLRLYRNPANEHWLAVTVNGTDMAWLEESASTGKNIYDAYSTGKTIYVNYTVTYDVNPSGSWDSATLTIYFGLKNEAGNIVWQKGFLYYPTSPAVISADSNSITFPARMFSSADQYTPNGVSMFVASTANYTVTVDHVAFETVTLS